MLDHTKQILPGKQTIHSPLPACGATAVTKVFCLCSKGCPHVQSRFTMFNNWFFNMVFLNPKELFVIHRLSKLAGEELSALQARNFSSAGDISAHASGVRILVLRVLKAAVSLTKAKGGKPDQVSRLAPMPFLACVSACLHYSCANGCTQTPHQDRM